MLTLTAKFIASILYYKLFIVFVRSIYTAVGTFATKKNTEKTKPNDYPLIPLKHFISDCSNGLNGIKYTLEASISNAINSGKFVIPFRHCN